MEEEFKGAEGTADVSDEQFQEITRNEKLINLVGCLSPRRVGVQIFNVRLEYFYFEPGTPKNDEYILHIINWQGMIWSVVSIPKECLEIAKKVAQETGLKIADGIPYLISSEQTVSFPITTPNVLTLENAKGSPVYKNDFKIIEELLDKEDAEIQEIQEKYQISKNN
jgi:hypothetical protein